MRGTVDTNHTRYLYVVQASKEHTFVNLCFVLNENTRYIAVTVDFARICCALAICAAYTNFGARAFLVPQHFYTSISAQSGTDFITNPCHVWLWKGSHCAVFGFRFAQFSAHNTVTFRYMRTGNIYRFFKARRGSAEVFTLSNLIIRNVSKC